MQRVLGVVAILVVGCGGSRPSPAVVSAPPPAVDAAVATKPPPSPPPDPYADLNLGFEAHDGVAPRGWTAGIGGGGATPGYEEVGVDDVVHGGARAFRIRATGGGEFAAAAVALDATALRGKHVRLHGWIKAEGVDTGWAGLWLRVDGGSTSVFDNMMDRGVHGTADWQEVVAEVIVPADGVQVVLGPLLAGSGTAWFDDLRLELVDAPPPHPIAVDGTVVDPAGHPIAGAEVALIAPDERRIVAHVATGADGRFHFDAQSGRKLGLSALAAGAVGAFVDGALREADADVTLALGATGGTTVRGTVRGVPAGTFVQIAPVSVHDSDLFAVAVGADGAFAATLPAGDRYHVVGIGDVLVEGWLARTGDVAEGALAAGAMAPPPDAVVAWVGAHATPLTTTEAGHGFDDLAGVGKLVGKAHVVGLGEATHGTREFFQLKHRVLEYLVAKKGFTVFAIEANEPECRAIDDYVLHGTGDAKTALAGIYFWTWDTEEVLAMIEWMRTWNADPAHRKKVHFVGFDMQTATVALASVTAYLAKVTPDDAAALTAPLAPLADDTVRQRLPASPDVRAALDAGLAAADRAFAAHRKAWTKRTGKAAFDVARHDLDVLGQAARMDGTPDFGHAYDVRDESMAANIAWIRAHQPKGTRMVVWAHNGHVALTDPAFHVMGAHLRETFGKDYVSVGFVFGQGSFQAVGDHGLDEHALGEPAAWDLSVPFTLTGHALLALDLRAIPKKGVVRDWFDAPHPMRETGAEFSTEAAMTPLVQIRTRFDAVLFVDRTTRARPVARP